MVRVLIATGMLMSLCVGCGQGDGATRCAVKGKVTLDGSPIEAGSIAFMPAGGTEGPTAGGQIEKGEYSIPSDKGPVEGRYRVEIRAPQKTGKMIQAPMAEEGTMVEETAESVPAKYNSESTLEEEIKAGKNVLDFELTSQ